MGAGLDGLTALTLCCVCIHELCAGSLAVRTRLAQEQSTCALQALLQRWAASCCTGADGAAGMAAALLPQLPVPRQPVASAVQPQAQVRGFGLLQSLALHHVTYAIWGMSSSIRGTSCDQCEDICLWCAGAAAASGRKLQGWGHKWTCKDGTLVGGHYTTAQQLSHRLQVFEQMPFHISLEPTWSEDQIKVGQSHCQSANLHSEQGLRVL